MGEKEEIESAAADGHRLQSVALDLHRQGMAGIGDQQGGGGKESGPHHLPITPWESIKDCPTTTPSALPLLMTKRLRKGSIPTVINSATSTFSANSTGLPSSSRKRRFSRFQLGEFAQPSAGSQVSLAQGFVLLQEHASSGDLFGRPTTQAQRHVDDELQWIKKRFQQTTRGIQTMRSVVDAHQGDRDHDDEDDPQGQEGSACEEKRRIGFDDRSPARKYRILKSDRVAIRSRDRKSLGLLLDSKISMPFRPPCRGPALRLGPRRSRDHRPRSPAPPFPARAGDRYRATKRRLRSARCRARPHPPRAPGVFSPRPREPR